MWERFKGLSWKAKAGSILAVTLIAAMLYGWFSDQKVLHNAKPTEAAVAPAAKDVPKVSIPANDIKVYKKAELKRKVVLPEAVNNDDSLEVSAVSDIAPSKGGSQVMAVIDTRTGETKLFSKELPRSLFGLENELRLGVGYGAGLRNGPEVKGYADYTFARVGKLYGSARAEVSQPTDLRGPADARATVNIEYRP